MTIKTFHDKNKNTGSFHSISSTFHNFSLSESEKFFIDITELKAIFFKVFTKKECFYKGRNFLRSYQYFIAVIRSVRQVFNASVFLAVEPLKIRFINTSDRPSRTRSAHIVWSDMWDKVEFVNRKTRIISSYILHHRKLWITDIRKLCDITDR